MPMQKQNEPVIFTMLHLLTRSRQGGLGPIKTSISRCLNRPTADYLENTKPLKRYF